MFLLRCCAIHLLVALRKLCVAAYIHQNKKNPKLFYQPIGLDDLNFVPLYDVIQRNVIRIEIMGYKLWMEFIKLWI